MSYSQRIFTTHALTTDPSCPDSGVEIISAIRPAADTVTATMSLAETSIASAKRKSSRGSRHDQD